MPRRKNSEKKEIEDYRHSGERRKNIPPAKIAASSGDTYLIPGEPHIPIHPSPQEALTYDASLQRLLRRKLSP